MSFADVKSFGEYLSRNADRHRAQDAAHARAELDRLMADLGSEVGSYDRLKRLVAELRADGFSEAAFHAIQALPLLKQAELHLERAKGRLG